MNNFNQEELKDFLDWKVSEVADGKPMDTAVEEISNHIKNIIEKICGHKM